MGQKSRLKGVKNVGVLLYDLKGRGIQNIPAALRRIFNVQIFVQSETLPKESYHT